MTELTQTGLNELFAETLDISSVRWFHKRNNQWFPFRGNDSIRLEEKYLELSEFQTENNNLFPVTTDTVLVEGNMYKANVTNRKMYPIFWSGQDESSMETEILRGTWFYQGSNLPVEPESLCDAIESHHKNLFSIDHIKEAFKELNVIERITQKLAKQIMPRLSHIEVEGYLIEWTGIKEVFICKPSLKQYLFNMTGLGRVGKRLTRGYYEVASKKDRLPNVNHICFIIQGIYINNSYHTENAFRFKFVCDKLMKILISNNPCVDKRIEIIPVNWNKTLLYDAHKLDTITPTNNSLFRSIVNGSALNIFLLNNQNFLLDLSESLKSELNRLFLQFCLHHKYFVKNNGQVSIIAHSFGSILMYDILQGRQLKHFDKETEEIKTDKKENESESCEVPVEVEESLERSLTMCLEAANNNENKSPKKSHSHLLFRVENLFNLGSPLALFLVLRAGKQNAVDVEDLIQPRFCKRFFNIFLPSDPMAYRIEPLINECHKQIDAMKISHLDMTLNLSSSSQSDKIISISNMDDSIKNSTNNIDKIYFCPEIADYYKFDRNDLESPAETLLQDLSKVGLPSKDHYEYNSARISTPGMSTTSFYYHKSANVLEARNASNIIYSINAVNDSDTFSKSTQFQKAPIKRIDSKECQNIGDTDRLDCVSSFNSAKDNQSNVCNEEALKCRLDFQLTEDPNESSHWLSLYSHESYWINEDLCHFILTNIFQETESDTNSS